MYYFILNYMQFFGRDIIVYSRKTRYLHHANVVEEDGIHEVHGPVTKLYKKGGD
jgi:hypothetical protein